MKDNIIDWGGGEDDKNDELKARSLHNETRGKFVYGCTKE